ncbi:MAG: 16S rRNA (uracil(1498)-N(3))-methyltransferase [Betaproteobacteria bacterium]|nr:16S rRNA (uracil(1498)-N(3))-methyltransferase [Betaproteobacteria bacterium]
MHRFYCATPIPPLPRWSLPDTVFHHAVRVLRLTVDDEMTLFDGSVYDYHVRIVSVTKHAAEVMLLGQSQESRESVLNLSLAQSLLNHDKMDWVIQKAVELGVKNIIPIITERSIVKLTQDKVQQRIERWVNIAIGACEQSGRNYIPTISQPQPLAPWLTNLTIDKRVVLHPEGGTVLNAINYQRGESVVFAVGPEGGFSAEEIELLRRHQFHSIRLGPRVLRTETAGLAALSCAQQLWGDFTG